MRLTDFQIKDKLLTKELKITPVVNPSDINGVTVDLHLWDRFRITKPTVAGFEVIDLGSDSIELNQSITETFSEEMVQDTLTLYPGDLALGVTLQRVTIPDNMVGWLDGRSTLARLGLMVHLTAHRIDPGWDGQIVLEFFNAGPKPLILRKGMKIGAISFEQLSMAVENPYRTRVDSTYKNQNGAKLATAGTTVVKGR
jgi:dCTP deaminase